MKPKISTGYLTPQAKKKKNVPRGRVSDTEEASESGFDENIFTALMKCPQKKKMILELLASSKEAIEKYKRDEARKLAKSPFGKVQSKKRACESPTALLRRRALEQMNASPSSTNKSSSSRSELSKPSSIYSEASSDCIASPVHFDKVLDGVVAFVEIKNKELDRSSGAKAVLKSLGATVREKFTNDVTHVIFKDGSFMTYQKAKLMKIHLVSILWVEFCRKTVTRQPEKQYPALKCGFQDNETSMICSQMQKEYEDIIRDEYRRSITQGTPLPSTKSLIDRRRTLMTPSVSNLHSSSSSFQTAVDDMSSQERSDREVAAINGINFQNEVVSQGSLILNDPSCFSDVSGPMVDGISIEKRQKGNSVTECILKSVENVNRLDSTKKNTGNVSPQKQTSAYDSDMELTMLLNSNKTPKAKSSKSDIYDEKTPKLQTQKIPTILFERRKTICNSLISCDTSTTTNISSDKSKNSSLISSDKSTNICGNAAFAVPKPVKKGKRSSNSLLDSNESFQFGSNKAKTGKIASAELDKTASAMSELRLSSDKDTSKSSSVMSSLQISSEKKESERSKSSTNRRSSSMSRLWLSSEQKSNEKPSEKTISMSDLRLSSETSHNRKEPSSVEVSLDLTNKLVDNFSSKDNKKSADKSSSVMSTLQVSAESRRSSGRASSRKNNKSSDQSLMPSLDMSKEKAPKNPLKQKTSADSSFSSLDEAGSLKNLVQTVIENLQTPEFVTARKNAHQSVLRASSSKASMDSDDSEILSPRKKLRKSTGRQQVEGSNNLDDRSCASDNHSSKNREVELLSNVTLRRKSLRARTDTNKVLVVNIIKSSLNNISLSSQDSSPVEEPASNKPKRRSLRKGKLFKTPDKSSSNQVNIVENVKSSENNNLNRRTRNIQKRDKAEKTLKNASSTSATESGMDSSSNSKSTSDGSSDSTKSKKKLRRLYNPDDPIHVLIDDEQERRDKWLEVRKRKPKVGVFINPMEVVKSSDKLPKETSISECAESSDDAESPRKRAKKGKKKDLKRVSLNGSADEQKELLNEVIRTKNKPGEVPKTPKSVIRNNPKTPKMQTPVETPSRRRSTRIIKTTQKLIDSQKSAVRSEVPITPKNRRSTLDFQPISSSKKLKKVDKTKLPTIVCTKLHKPDVQVFSQIIKKLGKFTVEDEVSSRTTHLVAGEPKRTVNMLRAISRGCWVVKFEWVLKSLEAGRWLREEDFEVHDFSPVVQKCRLERQAFGSRYTLDIFENCPPIFVALSTNPRCSDLKELITTCRGRVVTTPRMAKIIVGQYLLQEDTICVNETWVLDCITFNKKMAFKKQYLLDKEKDSKRKSVVV